MVLCGVGGATIEEAKWNVSHAEAVAWMDYRRKRGSLFVGNRLESGFGMVAWIIHRALGGKLEQNAFMPHAEKPDETVATTGQELMAFFVVNR